MKKISFAVQVFIFFTAVPLLAYMQLNHERVNVSIEETRTVVTEKKEKIMPSSSNSKVKELFKMELISVNQDIKNQP